MERKTFILTETKTFRRHIRVILKDKENKLERRPITFTTEHKITEKERNKNARRIAAEFSTNDEQIIDGLLRSTAYGKTFIMEGDKDAKLKREPFDITPIDAQKIALENLFEAANLEFDSSKSTEVLQAEYKIHMNAVAGTDVKDSRPAKIPHTPVDVEKQIQEQVANAHKAYEEKYGEPIPEEFAEDKGLLSALSDPNFDAKSYMAEKTKDTASDEVTIEELRDEYFKKLGVNVPTPMKNNKEWIKSKLAE